MALKNKDGSVYRLAGPNPAMKAQSVWSNFKLHNMKWSTDRYSHLAQTSPPPAPHTEPSAEKEVQIARSPLTEPSFVEELESTKPERIKIVVPESGKKGQSRKEESLVQREPEVHKDVKKEEEEEEAQIAKVFIHCLPATTTMKTDSLYGEVYKSVRYGEQYSFEGVVITETDIGMEFWTDVEVSLDSIVYPKVNSKRWWRVRNKEPKAMGVLYQCIPSEKQPSFQA